jgi:hypothetical protein
MRTRELFIFLFIAGLLAFNWPFTAVFGSGIPVYIFIAWGVFIALLRLVSGADEKTGKWD